MEFDITERLCLQTPLDNLSELLNSYMMTEIKRRCGRPRYGVDALPLPVVVGATGFACTVAAARRSKCRVGLAAAGLSLLAVTGIYLHTSLRGKFRIWERVLDDAALAGDEQVLDLGCGRDAVLVAAARRLPAGRAIGLDLWTKDQSGNGPEATRANAAAAGVAGRIDVRTGDMTDLPFAEESFDVVTAALAIHNIRSPEARETALDEAMRVLRPGGQLLIADITPMTRAYAAHLGHGDLRNLGPGYWYGGPWFGVSLLRVVKGRRSP